MRRFAIVGALATALLFVVGIAGASTPGADVRLTNDCHPDATCGAGYLSDYTLATGIPYTDQTLDECTISKGRENEPAVAVDPRDTNVLLGSSNEYCGVYNRGALAGAVGQIWLGYYRSPAGGSVIAWDNHGRAFFVSESSGEPAGSAKTFGDVFVARCRNPQGEAGPTARDGVEYYGSTVVARGSSAPGLLGVFNDKTAIESDRTGGACDGYVYFSWARFTAAKNSNIYFVRSTDHGVTWSQPHTITTSVKNVQDPDISVTGNGHVYVTFDEGSTNSGQTEGVGVVKSTD